MIGAPLTVAEGVGAMVALGVGLLIGVERERRKGEGARRAAAGVRSFILVALLGALTRLVGEDLVFTAALLGVATLAAASYLRSAADDPGLTTETALLVVLCIGALAMKQPALAGAVGVCVAAVLAIRAPLHRFIREALTEEELRDGLVLAAATFVLWPLLPMGAIGPFGALNLHAIWLVVILAMAIGAMGHVGVRLVGARLGVPLTGFVSGFISSTAVVASLAARAKREPSQSDAAVAGAVLSHVATLLQLSILVLAIDAAVLRPLALPLACAGAVTILYGSYFLAIALKAPGAPSERDGDKGAGAFGLWSALSFGALVCVVLVIAAASDAWFGPRGVLISAAITGLADVHAASVSAATLASDGQLTVSNAISAIVISFSANTIFKITMAFSAGGSAYTLKVTAGLLLAAVAAWIGLALST